MARRRSAWMSLRSEAANGRLIFSERASKQERESWLPPGFALLAFFVHYLFGFGGTFSPLRRAFERPIAIACFGLVTFFPLRPLFSLP